MAQGHQSKYNNRITWKKLLPYRNHIANNKYEIQLLKYFDFLNWGEHLFNVDAPE